MLGDNRQLDVKNNSLSGLFQVMFLLSIYFFSIVIAVSVIHAVIGDQDLTSVYNIRVSHAIQGTFLFLIPATLYAVLFADTRGEFLVKSQINIKTLGLAILLIFCIQTFVETVNHYNNLITLPESMADLEQFFKETKESSEKTLKLLFEDKSISSLLINILIIAVIPGIVEELYFRGCLQRSLNLASSNIHVAIWITAIIFSLLHFQLAGLFPRIILGAVLGYIYAWTRNIWVPIIVHIIHNATIVFVTQMLSDNDLYKSISISDYSLSNAGIAAFISLTLSATVFFFLYKNRAKEDSQ